MCAFKQQNIRKIDEKTKISLIGSMAFFVLLPLLAVSCRYHQPSAPIQCVWYSGIDYTDYQNVLNAFTHDGRVNYRQLKAKSKNFDHFVASVAFVGPRATPKFFKNDQTRLAFWINVYNAAALNEALREYPVSSLWSFWLSFEDRTHVFVDGREWTLTQIAEQIRIDSGSDPRVELAMSIPALGSPKLSGKVYRPESLDAQLSEALHGALDDPAQLKIDPAKKTISLGRAIYRHRVEFTARYNQQKKTSGATIVQALAMFASDTQRSRLNAAADYRVSEIPFDWSLNDLGDSSSQSIKGQ